jgi:LCCL domain
MRAGTLMFVVISLSTGCTMATSAGGALWTKPAASDESAGSEAPAGGVIEAGCNFNGGQLQGELGSEFQVACPDGCAAQGATWGSDVYTVDSAICRAGIHAGAIPATGGIVEVRLEAGRPAYRGSARNGIESYDHGAHAKSYAVLNAQEGPAMVAAAASAPDVIEAGCTYNGAQVVGEVGAHVVVACPAGCSGQGAVWGSDAYTIDSSVCAAAVHAGVIGDDGGEVGLSLEPGRPAYRGSTRNGVQSYDHGAKHKSFRLDRP